MSKKSQSILKNPLWYRWRQCQRSTSWWFLRILLFIVQLTFFGCNNEAGWPVAPASPTGPSAEVAISPQSPGALPASLAVFERVTKGEASLAEQQGMKLLMEQLQEMQPAVELASGNLYEKEMAKTKEWTEKIGQAGSEKEALRVLGEAEKALGDMGAFDTAVEVMKESVERQAEAGLKRLGKEWPQAKALGKCWRGCGWCLLQNGGCVRGERSRGS